MLLVLVTLLLASWACGLPGNRATVGPPSPTPPPTPAPQSWEEIQPPPPAGLVDALQAQVDTGALTHEQAIVSGLQILAGELDPAAALDEAPTSFEGSGVAFDAQRYLLFGTDEPTKAEITRLLPLLAPPPEVLLPYSVIESAARPGGARLARPYAQQECADLYANGFPPGPTVECFVVRQAELGSSTIQAFLPSAEQPEGYTPAFADAAMQAVTDALGVYSTLEVPGRPIVLKDIQVVFSLLGTARGTTLASVPTDPGQEPCQIILFPLAIAVSEEDMSGFKQTVAHEVFHCFQVWNFPALAHNARWGVQDWWGESTATYFSNVVYPQANDEWRWIEDWSYNSAATPLVYNSYDNFGFFQDLANRIGNDGVLELIQTLEPAADEDEAAQEALLAAFPGIEDLFIEYAVAYMDGTIADASGATIPTAPAIVLPMFHIDAADDTLIPFGASPFTITRYGVTFGSRQAYDLQPMAALSGYAALRPVNDVGQWKHLPAQVQGACTPRLYYVLMANADRETDDLGFGLTVTGGDPLDCAFTPTPPPAATEPGQAEVTAAFCPFGSFEGSTSFGYGCEDGGFRAWIDNDEQSYELISGSTGESYGDVVIEVDVQLVQGEDFSGALVLCRDQFQENFYYFKLSHDGVAVGEYNDGDDNYTLFGPLPPGTDPLATNRLRAECIGTHQALYVNGVLAGERDDDTVTHGSVGLGAGEGKSGMTEVFFENWEISQP
jgi:hypothetical protein